MWTLNPTPSVLPRDTEEDKDTGERRGGGHSRGERTPERDADGKCKRKMKEDFR